MIRHTFLSNLGSCMKIMKRGLFIIEQKKSILGSSMIVLSSILWGNRLIIFTICLGSWTKFKGCSVFEDGFWIYYHAYIHINEG